MAARKVSRRSLIGGALAAGSVAVAYAALGDPLGIIKDLDLAGDNGEAAALESESVRINHLLRRAGFGATRAEYDRYVGMGLDATIDELLSYSSIDDSAAVDLASAVPLGPADRAGPSLWWLIRMANTKRPLQEKMTLFWHGLLTSQLSVVRDPQAMVTQNELLRAHAFDSFPEVLRLVSMDRGMMVYLDTAGSRRGAPNENYARELMELFALGEGNYTEQDVREAARAFTGWTVPRTNVSAGVFTLEEPTFRAQQFDSGSKAFLGHTGNFKPDDIVEIIAAQPASGVYITRRLFSFFMFPDPSDADLAPFVEVYNGNERRIGAVVEAMLRSDIFYSPRAYRAIVKSPIEYAVSAIKALGQQQTTTEAIAASQHGARDSLFSAMGQVPFEPPNVAGWPGGTSWLNSATMFARLNFLNQLTGGAPQSRPARGSPTPVPAELPQGLGTATEALAYYLPLVLDGNVTDETRGVFTAFAGGDEVALTPQQLRGLVYLILASPQFHLS